MFYPIDFVNLTLAALIGGAIGFERQWNQGLAGLRTNTLVAFGAASFMALHVEQTAAYIVTGIGSLCAGDDTGRGLLAMQRHRSEENTSELQSPYELVCRRLLEKKKLTHARHHPG